jgi:hypothetical protein
MIRLVSRRPPGGIRTGWLGGLCGNSTSVSTWAADDIGQVPHFSLDSCMLGLRPRLVTRPSLIDLVTKKDFDRSTVLSPVEQEPLSIDLPESPIAHSSTNTTTSTAMAPSRDVESQEGEFSMSLLTIVQSS